MAGKIGTGEMIAAALLQERINEAFELMHAGKVIRSVLHYPARG